MMNRNVMQRQMFSRGGSASFPDLDGSGDVSRKDILIGRGVQGLALGGPPMMDPNMMPPAGPPMAPPQMGPEQALAGAEAQGQEMGMLAAEGVMQNIDGAQDYQSLIDGIRGNEQPLEARYAELGSIVGEQDARQTPESVLALTQPAIMMTEEGAVNSGIGELMQGIAGDTSMEGQMGEGVGGLMMAQADESMMEAGNTPPVNFRQGGPVEVQRLKAGGPPSAIDIAGRDLSKYQDFLSGGYDAEARAAELQKQREMSQAQMLFDLSQSALNFAGNTQGGSIAERLANSAAATQLPQRIGERAASMLTAEQGLTAEKRQLDMAARQAALAAGQSAVTARRAETLAGLKKTSTKTGFVDYYTVDDTGAAIFLDSIDRNTKAGEVRIAELKKSNNAVPASAVQGLLDADAALKTRLAEAGADIESGTLETVLSTFTKDVTYEIGGQTYTFKAGEAARLSNPEIAAIKRAGGNTEPFNSNASFTTFYNNEDPSITKLVDTTSAIGQKLLDTLQSTYTDNPLGAETAAKIKIEKFKSGERAKAAELLATSKLSLQSNEFSQEWGLLGETQAGRLNRDYLLNGYAVATREDNQLFTTGRDQTLNGYKTALATQAEEHTTELANLKGVQGVQAELLREAITQRLYKVKSEIDLADFMKTEGVKNVHEIALLGTQAEQRRELAKLNSTLSTFQQTRGFNHQIHMQGLRLIDNAQQSDLDRNLRKTLQTDAQLSAFKLQDYRLVKQAAQNVLDRAERLQLQGNSLASAAKLQGLVLKSRATLAGNSLASTEGIAAANRQARFMLQDDTQAANALAALLTEAGKNSRQLSEQEYKNLQRQYAETFDLKGARADRFFKAAESSLNRAHAATLQDDSLSARALNSSLDRAAQMDRQLNSQDWQTVMEEIARDQKLTDIESDQLFKAGQSLLERASREGMALGSQEHKTAMQAKQIISSEKINLSSTDARALEGMLDRAAAETRQLSDQEFRALESKLMKDFKGTQAEKVAAAKLFQDMISNRDNERGLDLTEARDIAAHASRVANQGLDQARFDREKLQAPLLAAKGTDATIRIISNQKDLTAYGNGSMKPTDVNVFENVIAHWLTSGSQNWDSSARGGQGAYVKTRNNLTPALKNAIEQRAENGLPTIDISKKGENLVPVGTPGSASAYRFNEDGTVNFDSFKDDPTFIITGIDLTKSQGFGSTVNRFFNVISEIAKDVTFDTFGGKGTKGSRITRAADTQLNALRRRTIEIMREEAAGRTFKIDVENLEAEVENFKPSGMGQDQGALDTLYTVRNVLAKQYAAATYIKNNAEIYVPQEISDANIVQPRVGKLIAEYTAAILVYERFINGSGPAQSTAASSQVTTSDGSQTSPPTLKPGKLTSGAARAN